MAFEGEKEAYPPIYGLMEETERGAWDDVFDPFALIQTGIAEVQSAPLELTGRGVLIGFADTGIDYTQEVFRRSDGSSRILALWDQENNRRYNNAELNAGNLMLTDEEGHGSALAQLAAGSRIAEGRGYLGAAPDAGILVVKMKQARKAVRDYYFVPDGVPVYEEPVIIEAVRFLDEKAAELGLPLVICLGIGSNLGAHNGKSGLEQVLDEIGRKKERVVVCCCGNEGNKLHHAIGSAQNTYYPIGGPRGGVYNLEIRVEEVQKGFTLSLWGIQPYRYLFTLKTPGGEIIRDIRIDSREVQKYDFIYERGVVYSGGQMVETTSGYQVLFLRFENPSNGVWTISVREADEESGWLLFSYLPIWQVSQDAVVFTQPSPYITLTIPSTAEYVISVSAYDARNGNYYAASGRGYTADARAKPDLVAPGVELPTRMGSVTGSSYAAALTAGAASQFMQWAITQGNRPDANTTVVKNYLIQGAEREEGSFYPSREWGYGRLNLSGTFQKMIPPTQ